jgi:hypothetical protein
VSDRSREIYAGWETFAKLPVVVAPFLIAVALVRQMWAAAIVIALFEVIAIIALRWVRSQM